MELQQLATVRRRLGQWRKKHGGRGRRIPESLWNDAVRVAQMAGVHETARTLRLRVEPLKARVVGLETPADDARRRPGTPFVELTDVGPLGGARTVVELTMGGQEKMRIHLAGASTADLVRLAEVFWSRRS